MPAGINKEKTWGLSYPKTKKKWRNWPLEWTSIEALRRFAIARLCANRSRECGSTFLWWFHVLIKIFTHGNAPETELQDKCCRMKNAKMTREKQTKKDRRAHGARKPVIRMPQSRGWLNSIRTQVLALSSGTLLFWSSSLLSFANPDYLPLGPTLKVASWNCLSSYTADYFTSISTFSLFVR